jgi:hypothetical protein
MAACSGGAPSLGATGTHTWRVTSPSSQGEAQLLSDTFTVGGISWRLRLYPSGNKAAAGSHLSLYLRMVDAVDKPYGWICPATVTLVVRSQASKPSVSMTASYDFHSRSSVQGYQKVRSEACGLVRTRQGIP